MPAHPVVNRRSLPTLKRRTMLATDDAVHQLAEIARTLHVSQGSLTDTALRLLAALPPDEIATHLFQHKHLTPEELDYVRERIQTLKKGTP